MKLLKNLTVTLCTFLVLSSTFCAEKTVRFRDTKSKPIDTEILTKIGKLSKPVKDQLANREINLDNVSREGFETFIDKFLDAIVAEDADGFKKAAEGLSIPTLAIATDTLVNLEINPDIVEPFLNPRPLTEKLLANKEIKKLETNAAKAQAISEFLNQTQIKSRSLDNLLSQAIFSDPAWQEWFWLTKKIRPSSLGGFKAKDQTVSSKKYTQLSSIISAPPQALIVAQPAIDEENPTENVPLVIASYPDNQNITISMPDKQSSLSITDLAVKHLAISPNNNELVYVTQENNELGVVYLPRIAKQLYNNQGKEVSASINQMGNSLIILGTLPNIQYYDRVSKRLEPYNPSINIDSITFADDENIFIAMKGSLIGLYNLKKHAFVGDLISLPTKVDITPNKEGQRLLIDFYQDTKNKENKKQHKLAIALSDPENKNKYTRVLTIPTLNQDWSKKLTESKVSAKFKLDNNKIKLLKSSVFKKIKNIQEIGAGPMGMIRGHVEDIKINPNGTEVAIGWENGTIELYPFETDKSVKVYRGLSRATQYAFKKIVKSVDRESEMHLAFSPSGNYLLATRPLSGKAQIFETLQEKNAVVVHLSKPGKKAITNLSWSPNNEFIVLATETELYRWDIEDKDFMEKIERITSKNIKDSMTIDGARALKYMHLFNIKRRKDLPTNVLPLFDALPDAIKVLFIFNREDYKRLTEKEIKKYAKKMTSAREELKSLDPDDEDMSSSEESESSD